MQYIERLEREWLIHGFGIFILYYDIGYNSLRYLQSAIKNRYSYRGCMTFLYLHQSRQQVFYAI